jgi:hypothetical protein
LLSGEFPERLTSCIKYQADTYLREYFDPKELIDNIDARGNLLANPSIIEGLIVKLRAAKHQILCKLNDSRVWEQMLVSLLQDIHYRLFFVKNEREMVMVQV